MQGNSDSQGDLWDVSSVAGHILPQCSVFSFLAEHRFELFPPAMFNDLFPSTRGRPSTPPEVVASVLVLQALHGLSDRAADAVTFDLRWKEACGLAVDGAAFHPTVLTCHGHGYDQGGAECSRTTRSDGTPWASPRPS